MKTDRTTNLRLVNSDSFDKSKMELRNSRFKLPIFPEPRQRKRKSSDELSTPRSSPESTSPREARLVSRLKRIEKTRDLPSPLQRKRMERRLEEIRKRRDAIVVDKEESVFCNSFVSARTFSRQLVAAVMKGDEERVRALFSDTRMPLDAATTQYSQVDNRTPIVEAFASSNSNLIMALLTERSEKMYNGIDADLLEPVYCKVNYGKFFLPTVPSDDSLALRKYAAPEKLKESLLTQLVRRDVPFSVIENFRPVSLYQRDALYSVDGVIGIIKKAHQVIGDTDGEFYTTDDYGAAAVEALRYGHCILSLNLARKRNQFTELTEEIITSTDSSKTAFHSNGLMYKRSDTSPYFLPIHAAAAKGRTDVLEWYFSQYGNALNLMDEQNWTPLHYAAAAESPNALKWIIVKGGSHQLSTRNKQGQTPLHVAVEAGRVENVKIITAALEALDRLCLNSDHLALENRTCLNWKNEKGESALHIAAGSGSLDLVEALCRHPFIDLNSRNKEGLTPFMLAAARGHLSCVELLSKTCIRQLDDLDRDTLIHAAINGQTNVVAFLLKSTPISHDWMDACHNSALHYACAYGWLRIVKLLVEVDSSLLALHNRKGLAPAVCAYRNGHFGIICWLLENGLEQHVSGNPGTQDDIKITVEEWMTKHDSDAPASKTKCTYVL